jgi:hypothetical protein
LLAAAGSGKPDDMRVRSRGLHRIAQSVPAPIPSWQARSFKRVLALPASEAHCERVIDPLREIMCPSGLRICEATICARLSADARRRLWVMTSAVASPGN